MAQHGTGESGLYLQLTHLQGSGAPHTENPDWSSEPLRALQLDVSAHKDAFVGRLYVFKKRHCIWLYFHVLYGLATCL